MYVAYVYSEPSLLAKTLGLIYGQLKAFSVEAKNEPLASSANRKHMHICTYVHIPHSTIANYVYIFRFECGKSERGRRVGSRSIKSSQRLGSFDFPAAVF